jgi:hypothetical protein
MTDGEKRTAQRILNYLGERPSAGDTLQGIATWWMIYQQLNETVLEVKRTLQHLAQSGQIMEQKMADGQTIYTVRRLE